MLHVSQRRTLLAFKWSHSVVILFSESDAVASFRYSV